MRGGKAEPVRLVFTAGAGPAVNAAIGQTGTRPRMVVNEIEVLKPDYDLPRLPSRAPCGGDAPLSPAATCRPEN